MISSSSGVHAYWRAGLRSKPLRRLLSLGVLVPILYYGALYIRVNIDELLAINISYRYVPLFLMACFSGFVLRGEMQQAIVQPYGIVLRFYEKLGLTLIPTLGNTILPANAGMAFKMIYLQKTHGIHFVVVALYLVISWITMTFADAASALLALLFFDRWYPTLTVYFGFLFLACVAMMILPFRMELLKKLGLFVWIIKFGLIKKAYDACLLIKENPQNGLGIMLVSIVMVLSNVIVLWTACLMLNRPIGFGLATILAGVMSTSTLINITPSSLGITEFMLAASAEVFGLGGIIGLTLSAVIRIGQIGIALLLSPAFYVVLLRKMSSAGRDGS